VGATILIHKHFTQTARQHHVLNSPTLPLYSFFVLGGGEASEAVRYSTQDRPGGLVPGREVTLYLSVPADRHPNTISGRGNISRRRRCLSLKAGMRSAQTRRKEHETRIAT
jgi:hypothetical protein